MKKGLTIEYLPSKLALRITSPTSPPVQMDETGEKIGMFMTELHDGEKLIDED